MPRIEIESIDREAGMDVTLYHRASDTLKFKSFGKRPSVWLDIQDDNNNRVTVFLDTADALDSIIEQARAIKAEIAEIPMRGEA